MSTDTKKIDVAHVARLARISLSDAECALFQKQMEHIVGHVQKVGQADISGVEPTAHGMPVTNVFRKDGTRPGLARDVVLANAPSSRDNQFVVPKIVE